MSQIRTGIGYDLHRLASGRRLWLGGAEVEYEKGLLGHSDGDVLLHAVTDALLGAAALGDIGEMFPDTDPAHKDADSKELLKTAYGRVCESGYRVGNVDVIIHAERPRLEGVKAAIRDSLASLLSVESLRVSVKAKTNEGLGPVGRGEAIACTVSLLLTKV